MREFYAQPGYVEADLEALLDSGTFTYADLFTIEPIVGDALRYTDAQANITVIPVGEGPSLETYFANQVIISGLRSKTSIGIEADQQTINLAYDDTILYQAYLTWPQALKDGRLDGAFIRRDRVFCETWGSPWIGGIKMFRGLVSDLDRVGRQSAEIRVDSDLILLNVQMPKDLWKPECKNTWADGAGCVINRTAHTVHTTVGAGSPTRTFLPWTGATDAFQMGTAYIESTDNVTRIRTILKVEAGVGVHLIYPLDFDPPVGADVAFQPNCRQLFDNCGDYHANPEEVFIGFPFVPVAETAA